MQMLRTASRRVWAFVREYWVIALWLAPAAVLFVLALLASGSN